jgi:hypothetical protein
MEPGPGVGQAQGGQPRLIPDAALPGDLFEKEGVCVGVDGGADCLLGESIQLLGRGGFALLDGDGVEDGQKLSLPNVPFQPFNHFNKLF